MTSAIISSLSSFIAVLLIAIWLLPERRIYRAVRVWRRLSFGLPLATAFLVVPMALALSPLSEQGIDRDPAPTAQPVTEGPFDDGAAVEKLRAYTGQIKAKQALLSDTPADTETEQPGLPDVETMIGRLAERLERKPDDAAGWRMLGWSYLHTQKYEQAASAYKKSLQLEPDNVDGKAGLQEALQGGGGESDGRAESAPGDMPEADEGMKNNAMVRGMVEQLAARLQKSSGNVDEWVRLMRARTVLGEKELAREALRNALAAFAEDQDSRARLQASAKEFGLSAY